MDNFNIIQFKKGKQKKTLLYWIKFGALLHLSLDTVSMIPGVEKRKVFNLVDDLQKKLNIEVLNDYIIQDEELLGYRIDRIVDKALQEYENPREV